MRDVIDESSMGTKLSELKDRLVALGGEFVILPMLEEDIDKILDRGEAFYPPILMRPRVSGQCHMNSAIMWAHENGPRKRLRVATGYALSDDTIWRQHSWIVDGQGRVRETTLPREIYYGFVMTERESWDFYDWNA
jgi:hypothetical protein